MSLNMLTLLLLISQNHLKPNLVWKKPLLEVVVAVAEAMDTVDFEAKGLDVRLVDPLATEAREDKSAKLVAAGDIVTKNLDFALL